MSRNGSGTYSLPIGNPVVTGTTISSTWANNTLTDIANALTGSLAADGQTTASGNLNMGTNKIVNAGDPTNPQDVATKYYVDQLIAALGTMAYQDADSVAITGGDISNVALDLSDQTGEMYVPVGPTILRTASPINGLIRYNTDAGGFYEGYVDGVWSRFSTFPEGDYSLEYLVIAGGGGGGAGTGGGGGAGGLLNNTVTVVPGTAYTITIGAGGAAGASGVNSSITGLATSIGGGYGATNIGAAAVGGSGGGGGADGFNGASAGAIGTTGQGYGGGSGGFAASPRSDGGGGGGGGASGAGTSAAPYGPAGNGGVGTQLSITGVATYYAGGGGGGAGNGGTTPPTAAGAGGAGGGGAGGGNSSGTGTNGSVNLGGGAGGGGGPYGTGGNGGSGVVILSMPTVNYSGTTSGSPTVTTSGSNTILKYTTSGSYTA